MTQIHILLVVFSIANMIYVNTIGKVLVSSYIRGLNTGANLVLIAVNVVKLLPL